MVGYSVDIFVDSTVQCFCMSVSENLTSPECVGKYSCFPRLLVRGKNGNSLYMLMYLIKYMHGLLSVCFSNLNIKLVFVRFYVNIMRI